MIADQQQETATDPATVAVTGATGYIGQVLVRELLEAGCKVIALSRRPTPFEAVQWLRYDLGEPFDGSRLGHVDAVIHLAAETHRGPSADVELELAAVRRLIDACSACGARFVYASSQTAQENAATAYGRSKWRCEQAVLAAGGLVVRPGQVYGGPEMGLFGTLCRVVRSSPFIPRLLPEPVVQPIHVGDLARGLRACALVADVASDVYLLAQPEPVPFSTFLRLLADLRYDRCVIRMPLPIRAISFMAHAPLIPQTARDAAQRLLSLASLVPMRTESSLAALDLTCRPLREGLSRPGNGRRRLLVAEARTLLRYVLAGTPPLDCVKHYVRAVEDLHCGAPLSLARVFRRWPTLLFLVDRPLARRRDTDAAFWERLQLAMVCAEASPHTASRFMVFSDSRRLVRVAGIGMQLAAEVCRQILGITFGFALKRLRPTIESEARIT